MAKLESTQFIMNDVSDGVVQGVKYSLCPVNSVELMINMVADEEIGEAVVRKGSTILGTQISANAVQNQYQFVGDLGTTKKLLTALDGKIYHYTGGTWTLGYNGLSTTNEINFETFLDTVVAVDGVSTPVASTNGESWGASSALGTSTMPKGKFIKVYKDQVVVAGVSTSPDTLYISSVPVAGIISWGVDNRSIVVNPEDGQNITALGEASSLLIIFKDHAMYRWNNRSLEADSVVNIGCSSQKSVVNCGSALAFFNEKGFWLTSGEQPIKISRKIQKFIDGRTSTFDVPCYGNEDYLYGSLGTCVVEGVTYDNIVARYSMLSKEWVIYKFPWEIRSFTRYQDTTDKIVCGTSLGYTFWIESTAMTDNGTDIGFEIKTHDIDFGSKGVRKQITERAMAYCKNPSHTIIQVKPDGVQWINLGTANKEVENFLIAKEIEGHYFQFRAVGISNNRTRFQGLELPNVNIMGY